MAFSLLPVLLAVCLAVGSATTSSSPTQQANDGARPIITAEAGYVTANSTVEKLARDFFSLFSMKLVLKVGEHKRVRLDLVLQRNTTQNSTTADPVELGEFLRSAKIIIPVVTQDGIGEEAFFVNQCQRVPNTAQHGLSNCTRRLLQGEGHQHCTVTVFDGSFSDRKQNVNAVGFDVLIGRNLTCGCGRRCRDRYPQCEEKEPRKGVCIFGQADVFKFSLEAKPSMLLRTRLVNFGGSFKLKVFNLAGTPIRTAGSKGHRTVVSFLEHSSRTAAINVTAVMHGTACRGGKVTCQPTRSAVDLFRGQVRKRQAATLVEVTCEGALADPFAVFVTATNRYGSHDAAVVFRDGKVVETTLPGSQQL